MTKKKTHEVFEKEVFDLVGDEYILIERYKGSKVKIKAIHAICNKEIYITPTAFLGGNRCVICYGNIRKTTGQFVDEVYYLVGDEYRVLGKYKNNRTHIQMLHSICNKNYKVTPWKFIEGNRCPHCSKNKKKTNKEFLKEIDDLEGGNYKALDKYINGKTKIRFQHNSRCNHIFSTTPQKFLSGQRCPKCVGCLRRDTASYIKEVMQITDGEYECLGLYNNYTSHIIHKHKKCGNEWSITPANFLKGHRCPRCNESKGEREICQWLKHNGINFEREYTFEDCINKRELPFDFAIKSKDGDLVMLIEYDGIQHFRSEEFFGGNEKFKATKKNDGIKNEYCKDNNINLIRIPYWDFNNIGDILDSNLHIVKDDEENLNGLY